MHADQIYLNIYYNIFGGNSILFKGGMLNFSYATT